VIGGKAGRLAVLALVVALPARAQSPGAAPGALAIKWVRDSEEYATLTRQVYRAAERAVTDAAARLPRGTPWAVVLDVDETALDNSAQQLEQAAYGLPFDTASWNAWTRRVEAGTVPGVAGFIAAVRRLGGHVAWITNRWDTTTDATRANLAAHGLWNDDDRLCLRSSAPADTKAVRRTEVTGGNGPCAWRGTAMTVLAYLGDQLGDFPAAGENDPDAGRDEAFGVRYFLLPDPMYGAWTTRVTRRRP